MRGYTNYIEAGTKHHREVALTFDDGPSDWTPRLIKVLRAEHAPATFFPVGYAIQRYGKYLQLEKRDGFVVGDHTMNHPVLQKVPRRDPGEGDRRPGVAPDRRRACPTRGFSARPTARSTRAPSGCSTRVAC